ncbi:MAG: PadR family transcriptional regulator [Chloroflexi bacterium]|nr:PadR family transcriptional regulator [Chloroflexota bacterium]
MSLKHAILGFLSYQSLTGYDLKQGFDRSVQHFWPADQGQIYRTLNQLEKAEWVTKELVPQEDRPNRKVYHITEAGRVELHTWLTTPLSPPPSREPFLIQIFLGGLMSDEELLTIVTAEANQAKEKIAILSNVMTSYEEKQTEGMNKHFFQSLLTLESGLHMSRAYLQWLESVETRIQSQDRSLNN